MIGLRFHSVVFATAAGIPATSFSWEPKTTAFLAENHITPLDTAAQPTQTTAWLDTCISRPTSHHPATPAVEATPKKFTR